MTTGAAAAVCRRRAVPLHRARPGPARQVPLGRKGRGNKGRRNLPRQVEDYYKPLYWLKDASGARRRCLPVDSSQARFEDFTTAFAHPVSWVEQGQVVLVTGERGYGKTSLIQRCAVWLRDEAERTENCRLITVDLSDFRWPEDEAAEERMRRTLRRMAMGMGSLLNASEYEEITRRPDVTEAFYDLGIVLDSRRDSNNLPVVLMVLLQGYPTIAELTGYYNAAGRGMFFFAEMFQRSEWSSVIDNMSNFNRNGADLRSLHLDDVKADDVQAFADWIEGPGGSWIKENWGRRIVADDIPAFTEDFIADVRSYLFEVEFGARFFVTMMLGALRVAMEADAPEVRGIHLAAYLQGLAESV